MELIGFSLHSTSASAFSFFHLTLTSSLLLSLISDLKVWGLVKYYKEVIIRVALETYLEIKSLSLSYIQIILTIHARTNEVCLYFPLLE